LTPRPSEAALRAEVAEALPELLQLADLEVRIPRMEVVARGRTEKDHPQMTQMYADGSAFICIHPRPSADKPSRWIAKRVPASTGGIHVARNVGQGSSSRGKTLFINASAFPKNTSSFRNNTSAF